MRHGLISGMGKGWEDSRLGMVVVPSVPRSSDAIVYQHYRVPACKEWERGFPSGLSSPRFALCWALDMLPVEIQLLEYLP
jgi:hypothetical protein